MIAEFETQGRGQLHKLNQHDSRNVADQNQITVDREDSNVNVHTD